MIALSSDNRRLLVQSSLSCYCAEGAADPGLRPRVLEPFAKPGLVPERSFAQPGHHGSGALAIDLQVRGLSPAGRKLVAACLPRTPLVETVPAPRKVIA